MSASFMEIVMALMPNVSDELRELIFDVLSPKVAFYARLKADPKLAEEWQQKRALLEQFITIERAPF
jgi:hypothetical protein